MGTYTSEHCILGHRRLAIIDLSKDGHQPFSSEDNRYQLIYNGEIYNYIELRAELEGLGWRFRTRTDTEVLLKAYQQFGEACLSKFNGMFAFVLYDSWNETLFLARDRLGIKPLYYLILGPRFYFASEVKALTIIPRFNASMNQQSLFDYLVFNRTDIHDETFLQEIRRLPKGHWATLDQTGLRMRQWWNPEEYLFNPPGHDPGHIAREIEEIMVSSVRLRMRSDVPVGSCLSGGLDSSILIGILYHHLDVRDGYQTFTASFPGHPIDETRYVDLLKKRFPFKNMRTFPTAQTALSRLKDFVYANDDPTTSPSFYSQYEVMRLAREHGVTVLLDGQGGDENFAGYHYFHGFNLYGLFRERRWAPFVLELLRSLIRRQDRSAYQTFLFQILPHRVRERLLLKTVPYIQPDFFYEYIEKSRVYTGFFDAPNLNYSIARHFQYKLEHLLRMEDRNSMAFSLEARVPYLDYRLVEYLLGVSGEWKIRKGETKFLQKKALGHYTARDILERRDKIGFGTPGEEWMLTGEWKRQTLKSHKELMEAYPGIFKRDAPLPLKGFDRWKINQLATWRQLFLS